MAPWKLPLIVAAIAVPVVAGFAIGGPGVGVAVGALAAVALLVVAAHQRPDEPIVPPPADDGRRHVLVVVTCPVEEPATVHAIARAAELDGPDEELDVLALAPARIGFLDRWTSDVESAREAAQQKLVATVAALAKAGIAAEARVGDEDVVQAIEDQLQSFPANTVVLVTGGPGEDEAAAGAVGELKSRLQVEFHHIALSSPGR
ncbi:MAG: hypothetical protein WBM00_07130 [Solirubrobacterales bacterium]